MPLQVSGGLQALLASSHSSFILLRTRDWLSSALQGQSYSLALFVLGLGAGCWHLWNCALGVTTSYSLGNLLFSGFYHLLSTGAGRLSKLAAFILDLGALCIWWSPWDQPSWLFPSAPPFHSPPGVSVPLLKQCVSSGNMLDLFGGALPKAGDGASEILSPLALPAPQCFSCSFRHYSQLHLLLTPWPKLAFSTRQLRPSNCPGPKSSSHS